MTLTDTYKKFPTAIDTRNKIPTRMQKVDSRTEYFLNLFEENIGYSVLLEQGSVTIDVKINEDIELEALQKASELVSKKRLQGRNYKDRRYRIKQHV